MAGEETFDITQTGLKTRLAREMAMQLVFVYDVENGPIDVENGPRPGLAEAVTAHAAAAFRDEHGTGTDAQRELAAARRRAVAAADGVWSQWAPITENLARLAPQWPPHRMPASDRAVLRLAAWELQNTPTPANVVLDEAIELAKRYGTADSYRFVNGVLDAILKERDASLAGTQGPETVP